MENETFLGQFPENDSKASKKALRQEAKKEKTEKRKAESAELSNQIDVEN